MALDPPSWATSPDPAVVERQALLAQLNIADDPNLSTADLRARTGYGADVDSAARVGGYTAQQLIGSVDTIDDRMTAAETKNTEQDGRLTVIEGNDASVATVGLLAGQDFDLLTPSRFTVYRMDQVATDFNAQHMPANVRCAVKVTPIGAEFIQEVVSWEPTARTWIRRRNAGVWGGWILTANDTTDATRLTVLEGNTNSVGLNQGTAATDLDTLTPVRNTIYNLGVTPTDFVAQHFPYNGRGILTAYPMNTEYIHVFYTWETVPRIFSRRRSAGAWSAWALESQDLTRLTAIETVNAGQRSRGVDFLNPIEYGLDPTGVTSNSAVTNTLVNDALAAGKAIYWPPGSYLVGANITNLHKVKHLGPGAVKTGSNLFYVAPSGVIANTLYVDPAGSDTNDGLAAGSTRAFATIQAAYDALANYGPYITGTWTIQLAAGTYTKAIFPRVSSEKAIVTKGPSRPYPLVPTAIITNGYNFVGTGIDAYYVDARCTFQDLQVVGYNGNASTVGIGYADSPGEVACINVHFTDCYYGLSTQRSSLDVKGGVFTRCGYLGDTPNTDPPAGRNGQGAGTRSFMVSVHSIGLQNAGNNTNGPIFDKCYVGVFTQEATTGHVDWATFQDCAIGITIGSRSRANTDGCLFKRNGQDVRAQLNSDVFMTANTTFSTGADESSAKLNLTSGSQAGDSNKMITEISPIYAGTLKPLEVVWPDSLIQTTGNTTVYTRTLKGNMWRDYRSPLVARKQLRLGITGTCAGTAGTKTCIVRLGASLVACTITATETGVWYAEVDIVFSDTAEQRMAMRLFKHLATSQRVSTVVATNAMTADTTLTVEGNVAVVTDSITINTIKVDMV